jgi:hypothetical protein
MSSPNTVRLTTIAASLLLGACAWALPFNAPMDIQASGGQTEAGAIAVNGSAHNTTSDLATTNLVSLGGDPFTIAIDDQNALNQDTGSIDWRDRGNAAATPLARLAEDFLKNNNGIIRVTLGQLPTGLYRATSYHIDPVNSQSEDIRILVDDARVGGYIDTGVTGDASYPGHPSNANAPGVGGLTTAIVQSKARTFTFHANGTDPVRILFDASAAAIDDEAPLDGLHVVRTDVDNQLRDYAFIDIGPNGQRVEPGYTAVTSTGPVTVHDTQHHSSFTVALSPVDWRDRGNGSSDDLIALGEDFVKRNDGDITVTLRGLRAGTFLVSSFHVDPDFDQCPAIEVYVTDDVGTDVLQSTLGNADIGVGGVGGLITDEVLFTSNVFQIVSNGTDDVILRFNGTGNDLEVPLNGLAFQLVTPEPGTVTLLALGGLGALLRRRRSRRA